ncbi:MAG: ribosome maturation factor RimP [Candidatus Hydrogenedens sp.]|jgi:ribosome maturation factor RimP|nr:ribosome maturation factor RimP [Candidatus Hydrogenedens sp.]
METDALVRQAWLLLEPDLQQLGFELVEVEMSRHAGAPLLRIYIDKEGSGITMDECTQASRMMDPLLDSADFLDGRYMLEVSSPGISRPLRKPAHFERYCGEPVRVETRAPVVGRSRFRGILRALDGDLIRIQMGNVEVALHLENIKKARLDL